MPNTTFKVDSKERDCFAESIPASRFGNDGKTKVYRLESGSPRLESTYNWYSHGIFLKNLDPGVSVARLGPWPGGAEAHPKDLALAFYLAGKELKRYSTLDIAIDPNNVTTTVSHYQFWGQIHGYVHNRQSQKWEFKVENLSGRLLSFDPITGRLLSNEDKYEFFRKSSWYLEKKSWVLNQRAQLKDRDFTTICVSRMNCDIPGSDKPPSTPMTILLMPERPFDLISTNLLHSLWGLKCLRSQFPDALPKSGELWAFAVFGETNAVTPRQKFAPFVANLHAAMRVETAPPDE